MIPAKPGIVECPHCGGRKALLTLASWNTFGATYWSDTKMFGPYMERISPVQICPVCGQYYLLQILFRQSVTSEYGRYPDRLTRTQ